jgi:hypothetical protein
LALCQKIFLKAPIDIQGIVAPLSKNHLQDNPQLVLRVIQGGGVFLEWTWLISKISLIIILVHVSPINTFIEFSSWFFV